MALALQARHMGWHSHAMGGFDRDRLRAALKLPESFSLHAVVALGKRGEAAQLPDALREREVPSPRRPLVDLMAEATVDGTAAWHR